MHARQIGYCAAGVALSLLLSTCGGGGGGGGGGGCTGTFTGTAPAVNDPLFADQWHLRNTGQAGGCAGQDVNISALWNANTKGTGVRIAVVDDGLEIGHEDLSPNVVMGESFNYNGGTDPTGGQHGTAVGGVAAARDSNGLGGAGAAPARASLATIFSRTSAPATRPTR